MTKIGKVMGATGFALIIVLQVMSMAWSNLVLGFTIPYSNFIHYLSFYGGYGLICIAFLLMFIETKSKSDLALLCCFFIEYLFDDILFRFVPSSLLGYMVLIFNIAICIIMIINATKNGNTLVSVLCCVAVCLFVFRQFWDTIFNLPFIVARIICICTSLIFALYCITKQEY